MPQAPTVVRTDVELVPVDVEVFDSNGRIVSGLTRDDFSITEDGKPQPVQNFSLLRIPFRTLVLIDCSGSLDESRQWIESAVGNFIAGLGPLDYVGVAAFGSTSETLIDWTRPDRWAKHVEIPFGMPFCREGTNLYGNVVSAVQHLGKFDGHRAALIITDGIHSMTPVAATKIAGLNVGRIVDPSDDPEFEKTVKTLREAGVPLYFAALNTDLNPISMSPMLQPATDYSPAAIYNSQQVRARIEQMAAISNGYVVFPRIPKDYAPLFKQIEQDLGYVYSLSYTPPAPGDGKFHRIQVRTRDNRLRVRQSRDGHGMPNR